MAEEKFIQAVLSNKLSEVEEYLKDENFNVNCTYNSVNNGPVTALDIAAARGNIRLIEMLLKHPKVKVAAIPNSSRTALHLAIQYRQVEACKLLLPVCDILAGDKKTKPAFYLAGDVILSNQDLPGEYEKAKEVMELLKEPTFVEACRAGKLSLVRDTINWEGVNYNATFGLLIACIEGHEPVVDYLLTLKDIDIHKKTEGGMNILHVISIANSLRKYGKFTGATTPLASIAQKLICRGAKIDEKDNIGATPLAYAVFHGRLDMTKALVSRGARLDFKYKSNCDSEEMIDIFQLAEEVTDPAIQAYLQEEKISTTRKIYTPQQFNAFLSNRMNLINPKLLQPRLAEDNCLVSFKT